jgi:glycosyltransferase involved in cell wall biosynthesis
MNPDNILLSIVIPCFNDGRFLLEAVESAERNKSGRYEIIIVDDGSNDPETLRVLAAVKARGHRLLHQPNRGQGAARNHGIAEARGGYILLLDSDNRIQPAYIDRGIEILETKPAIDVVYSDMNYFGDKTGPNLIPDFNLRRLLIWNYIDACAVFRKTAWERCGGFDESLVVKGFEDWDLWCRIACGGGGFYHLPELLFDYRVRNDSTSAIVAEPARRAAMLEYMMGKKIEVTVGDYVQAYQSWDPVLDLIRRQPVRTAARLFVKAFLPGLKSQSRASKTGN